MLNHIQSIIVMATVVLTGIVAALFMKGHVDYKIEPFHKFFNLLELGFFKICDKIGAGRQYFDLKKSEEVQGYQPEFGWEDIVDKGHKKAAR